MPCRSLRVRQVVGSKDKGHGQTTERESRGHHRVAWQTEPGFDCRHPRADACVQRPGQPPRLSAGFPSVCQLGDAVEPPRLSFTTANLHADFTDTTVGRRIKEPPECVACQSNPRGGSNLSATEHGGDANSIVGYPGRQPHDSRYRGSVKMKYHILGRLVETPVDGRTKQPAEAGRGHSANNRRSLQR